MENSEILRFVPGITTNNYPLIRRFSYGISWKVLVQEVADREDFDEKSEAEDKNLAAKLLEILYATEDGFAVPEGSNEEF